ncbi:MAG: 4Fe-4S binding protein [Rhodocyclaceae bacterium]|nr:4Fe-4S binding protein [Rhodocyclaceae bacterium]
MISRRDFLRGRLRAPPAASGPRQAAIDGRCMTFQNVVCRSCSDACGEGAIRFSPRRMAAALPEVLAERCTGCGECVTACPAGAIRLVAASRLP